MTDSRLAKRRRIGLMAAAGYLLYSRAANDRHQPLPHAIDAERRTAGFSTEALSYYVDSSGTGRPLLLLHSINAAPSAFEIKPLFQHYRGKRPVYAIDLPGFGLSDRSERPYTVELYTETIQKFVADEIGETVDIIALSLTGEFAARAALNSDAQALYHSIVMISPTGFMPKPIVIPSWLYSVFSFPLIQGPLFSLLTVKSIIRYYLNQNFVGDAPDDLIDYAHATAHQPGAANAPLYFVSGQLFSSDIRESVYAQLQVPTLVVYDKDPNVSLEALPAFVEAHSTWHATRLVPSHGLPHWERLEETVEAIEAFWSTLGGLYY